MDNLPPKLNADLHTWWNSPDINYEVGCSFRARNTCNTWHRASLEQTVKCSQRLLASPSSAMAQHIVGLQQALAVHVPDCPTMRQIGPHLTPISHRHPVHLPGPAAVLPSLSLSSTGTTLRPALHCTFPVAPVPTNPAQTFLRLAWGPRSWTKEVTKRNMFPQGTRKKSSIVKLPKTVTNIPLFL